MTDEKTELPEHYQPRAKAVEIGVYKHGDALAYIVTLEHWVELFNADAIGPMLHQAADALRATALEYGPYPTDQTNGDRDG